MDPNLGLPLQPHLNFAEFGAPARRHQRVNNPFSLKKFIFILGLNYGGLLYRPMKKRLKVNDG